MMEETLEEFDELQEFLVLLVDANDEPIRGRVKLQNIMFLLSEIIKEIKDKTRYHAGVSGPHSEIIDNKVYHLEEIQVLDTKQDDISLTKKGKEIADIVRKKSGKRILHLFKEYKGLVKDLSDDEMLTYVYLAHPKMANGSTAYDKLKPHMEEHVLSLIKKEKISSQRAAELLHKTQTYVMDKMKEKGLLVLEF